MPFRFESLAIWHQAREFSALIFKIAIRFPDAEKYGLAGQMTRAADSIVLNIAEGAGRNSDNDFNRFLAIAIGSTFEVASASVLALDKGYIDQATHERIYHQAQQLGKAINTFRKTLRTR